MPRYYGDHVQKIGIHVQRGRDLVNRDLTSLSDPYVVVRMGKQELKTKAVSNNLNPEWNCHLTLPISDHDTQVKLSVYDRDTFSRDDPMGDAVIDIKPFLAAKEKSQDGKAVHNMSLKLQNVESGQVELQLYSPIRE